LNILPPNALTGQWRVVWLSVFSAGFAFLSTLPWNVSDASRRGFMLPGIVIALSGAQVHLAVRLTRRVDPSRFRAWMPWLMGSLYTLGVSCIGIGVLGF
jgi:hypothetical protein